MQCLVLQLVLLLVLLVLLLASLAALPCNILKILCLCATHFCSWLLSKMVIKSRAHSTATSNFLVSLVDQSCLLIMGSSPLKSWYSSNFSLASIGRSGIAWLSNLLRSCRNEGTASPENKFSNQTFSVLKKQTEVTCF